MLMLDGNACWWNIFGEVLESEDYDVWKACNDAKELPRPSLSSWL
jgi:hypothetical protein